MNECMTAALPWLLLGFALAFLAVYYAQDETQGARSALGAGLGLLLGVFLNSCGLWADRAMSYAVCTLLGMAAAACFSAGRTANKKRR